MGFADFEGIVSDMGDKDQIAVYRVTLPSRGLDPDKWVGRPPPPAPEELYTGPRRDGLLSTDEISGEYSAPGCVECYICNSMTVVPLGADTIETWRTGCCFLPPFACGPIAEGEVLPRTFKGTGNTQLGTNAFGDMTFSAGGTARATQGCGSYKKCPGSQKRSFQKVEARDLAGKWRGCCCIPIVLYWPGSPVFCTSKKALDQDRYEESGLTNCLCLPCSDSGTRTRVYVNGHPTNGFAEDDGSGVHWHRGPGCAGSFENACTFFAKKVG